MAYLRLAVRGDDEGAVGRAFSGAVVETSLSSYPGTFFTSAPTGAQGVARYWPTTVAASAVTPHIECDGRGRSPPRRPPSPRRRPVDRCPATASRRRPRSGLQSRPAPAADLSGAAVGPRRGALGGQGRRRQRGRLGRRGRRRRLAPAEFTVDVHRAPARAPALRGRAGTRCRTCGRSTSSCTASSAGAWRRTCGWTPRRRAWVSCCARASSRCRPPSWRAGGRREARPAWPVSGRTAGRRRPGIWQDDARGARPPGRHSSRASPSSCSRSGASSPSLVVPRATSSRLLRHASARSLSASARRSRRASRTSRRGTASSRSSDPPPWSHCSCCGCA